MIDKNITVDVFYHNSPSMQTIENVGTCEVKGNWFEIGAYVKLETDFYEYEIFLIPFNSVRSVRKRVRGKMNGG